MSEGPKMGQSVSTGPKEECNQNIHKAEEDSVEKLTENKPVDSHKEAANTMDINDIIGIQSEAATESTLESEIDALSKIITDTKDGAQKLDDNDEDFKLDGDDIAFTASLQCDSMESDNCELLSNNTYDIKNILDNPEEIENFMSTSTNDNSLQELIKETSKSVDQENDNSSQELTENAKISAVSSEEELTNENNSLSLICEAYNSQESQESYPECQLTPVPENVKEVENVQNKQNSEVDSKFIPMGSENEQALSTLSTQMCEGNETKKNTVEQKTHTETMPELIEQNSNQEKVEIESVKEYESDQINISEKKELATQSCPLEVNEKEDNNSITISQIRENIEETLTKIEDLNNKEENDTELQNTSIEETSNSEEKIIKLKNVESEFVESSEIQSSSEFITKESESDNVESLTASKNIEQNIEDSRISENIEQNIEDSRISENIEQNIEDSRTSENTEDSRISENIEDSRISENIIQNIEDSKISENIENNIADTEAFENVEQNIEDSKITKDTKNLNKPIENEIMNKEIIHENTIESNTESLINNNVEVNILQEEVLKENNESKLENVDNAADTDIEDTKDLEMNEESDNLPNVKTSTENENEEKRIENLQNTNINMNIEIVKTKEQEENIENLQKMEVDTHIQCVLDTENNKGSENLQNTVLNANSESNTVNVAEEKETINTIKPIEGIESLKCLDEISNNCELLKNVAESLENSEININDKTLQEAEIISDTLTSQDMEISETEKPEVLQNTDIAFLENTDADNHSESINTKVAEKSIEAPITIPVTEYDVVSATSSKNVIEKEMSLEHLLTTKSNETLEQDVITADECKEEKGVDNNSITDSVLQEDYTLNQSKNINEDLSESENINNEFQKTTEEIPSKHQLALVEEESINEDLIPARVETPEDLNITLELEESEISEKINVIDSKEIQDHKILDHANESKIEKEIMSDLIGNDEIPTEVNLEESSKKNEQNLNTEVEDRVDINLSLDFDDYSSPLIQELPEEQISLNNPLDEFVDNLVDSENIDVTKASETPETMEQDLSEVLDANQKVDEFIDTDQELDPQELATSIIDEVEKELGSDLNELLETEENINDPVKDFANLESSNLPSDMEALNQTSQDPLSVLDALQTESISLDQENLENRDSSTTEKEENVSLIFEESSQSPKKTEDEIDETSDALEKITECNKSESVDKQNKEDVEKGEVDEIFTSSEIPLEIEENVQFDLIETSENDSKVSISDAEKEVIMDEASAEISELESAVKFLQESEEQDINVPNMTEDETVIEKSSSIFVSVDESMCDNVSELVSDLPEVAMDPIAISEAEIISEAAKLENERKEKIEFEQQLMNLNEDTSNLDNLDATDACALSTIDNLLTVTEPNETINITSATNENIEKMPLIAETEVPSDSLTSVSKSDERYKEPSNIEIPEVSSPKVCDPPNTPKASLLIQKDAKQRLESPERAGSVEPRITETPKKDADKQQQQQQQYAECENVGSPRIILKIAKSAITECSEPRSPKSPKIRSAANSPNPEDSPGHKLGKIKLKLSKGGHPSIIPNNDNYEDTAQWHTDSTSSLSPLGMKIKLTKSSDASAVEHKHEEHEEVKEKSSHKSDEGRKSEASIGMKIKLSKSGDASIVQQDSKEGTQQETVAKKQDSPSIGMKIKLSKSGDASIIQQDSKTHSVDDGRESVTKSKDKMIEDTQDIPRRTDSPFGVKIKLSKSGDTATVISNDPLDLESDEPPKRTDSPIGVKIKLTKTKGGTASIITNEILEETKEKLDSADSSKRIKLSKKKEVSEDISETTESDNDGVDEISKASIGMKIKFSKDGDASVVHSVKEDETIKKITEQPLGMKIKLSKTGDPSIIHSEVSKETEDIPHGVKSKHSKNKDHSSTNQQKSKDDSHLEMKIKLSKTGHPTIITTNELQDDPQKIANLAAAQSHKYKDHKDSQFFKETTLKTLKKNHSDITIEPIKSQTVENTMIDLHNKRKEITIAPIESKKSKVESNLKQMLPDITIQPIIPKKEQQIQQQQKLLLESNNANISQQQMNVINQEISITQTQNSQIHSNNGECKLPQICSLATGDTLMGERLKSVLNLPSEGSASSPLNSDCEIIEPVQPELIIVNENSNSSQDVMIIDEVPSVKLSAKAPKKRGRPRRNANVAAAVGRPIGFPQLNMQRDPLSLDQPPILAMMQLPTSMTAQPIQQVFQQSHQQLHPQLGLGAGAEGSERPRRTCRSQKSYAPPKRGRGRGRGKRRNEAVDIPMKKQRIDQDLTAIESSTTAVISLEKLPIDATTGITASPELFKALNQPTLERVVSQQRDVEILEVPVTADPSSGCDDVEMTAEEEVQKLQPETQESIEEDVIEIHEVMTTAALDTSASAATVSAALDSAKDIVLVSDTVSDKTNDKEPSHDKPDIIPILKVTDEEKQPEVVAEQAEIAETNKDSLVIQEHQNWLAPSIKKVSSESVTRSESLSTLTVIDEETRMSAESGSRSQTPARSMTVPGTSEPLLNEESQGSVLSTATTESEKVKVQKVRRMEITLDPDEGPFTVDKIAEYEWPLKEERPAGRGETFMIQEQISQYLGVKSFKRKYPDLKRRMVDMEERNFLRENGLVSESMCDMGLTAVSSSEVLDIMCSDFPEQYEEYRKHMREKAAKEHSKKQKELSAAANAERTRIDLAEMAMQSAISWNAGLNKARHDSRKCSLDLQTFTVHMPKRPARLDSGKKSNHYPVALIPGQYTEYYREYTPAELRYYPLNTVLYGPMRPNERKFDSQSEGSQSDSDSESSSDDSSSSSSEGTQDTEGSQSTMDEVDMELAVQSDVKCKMCLNNLNKSNRPEVLIQCGTCNGNVHPSCIDLTLDMVPHIRAYAWQCTDCKTCAQCHDPADEDKMLFCDMCDRGYHIYCVGLRRVPQGRWHCQECAVCANCGSKEPGGANSDRNSVAQWQHEYKKGDKNTRVYVSTFCVPCSKLWRKGRYCPHCSRCHNAPRLDLEPNLVHCAACDKYLHLGCVETKGVIIDKKHYLCDFCSPNRQQLVKPLISKTFKT